MFDRLELTGSLDFEKLGLMQDLDAARFHSCAEVRVCVCVHRIKRGAVLFNCTPHYISTHTFTCLRVQDVKHEWIELLAPNCTRLRDLDLSKCTEITDKVRVLSSVHRYG